ncbi:MAG: galactosyldiacylglycerol synthase [Trueperaceae bacterium]
MIKLFDVDTNKELGEISEADVAFMKAQMEEEFESDQDYYIHKSLLEIWQTQGASDALIALLSTAMSDKEDINVRWES